MSQADREVIADANKRLLFAGKKLSDFAHETLGILKK
jgi:hypothetical protein